ncbi:hypothetical protein CEXT_634201 [Caerostris extrusa]|uniref:Uncharacterized protein n=1 Tax=Caerostris extrusa TaxID=172846 RepID=A0AAV4RIU7_CAEEX|nr:hypothetical protein CEXT_634201 [Caerostris extrusa]
MLYEQQQHKKSVGWNEILKGQCPAQCITEIGVWAVPRGAALCEWGVTSPASPKCKYCLILCLPAHRLSKWIKGKRSRRQTRDQSKEKKTLDRWLTTALLSTALLENIKIV